MRILHILDHSSPLTTGYALRTRAILEQQRALGLETFQITSAKHPGPQALVEDVDGFRFFRTPSPDKWYARWPVLRQLSVVDGLAKRLGEVVEEVKPDILHAHSPALNGLAALRVAHWYALPIVYECRAFWEDAAVGRGLSREGSLRYRATRLLEGYVFKRAQAVAALCEGLGRDILRRGVPALKLTVVPNGVDLQKFALAGPPDPAFREELGLAEGQRALGFIGSFNAYEGLALLLEAMPRMLREWPGLRLLLVGSGPEDARLRDRAEALGLGGSVAFLGQVHHDKVQKYYEQIDILVYPRLPMRLTELTTPLKPLEALALGRLVVASDVGGHKELIADRATGWLFKAGDVEALARTVLELLGQPSCWPTLRRAGRAFAEAERSWEDCARRYLDIYQNLLAEGR
jgi:PEP-CTERM/exosortase A-associated glycosyltransferase